MRFTDLLRMSLNSLMKRKVRTILTVLGVVIGTASIVVMISLGLGLSNAIMSDLESYGSITAITVRESYGYNDSGSKKESEQKRLDDDLVEELKQLPHVTFVAPQLQTNVMLKSGLYECNEQLTGIPAEIMGQMGFKPGQGDIPKPGEKLQFYYGNQVLTDFYNAKTNAYYWDTGVLPDVDLMNDTIFVIFDTDAYWRWKYPSEGEVTQPPKKYVIPASGVEQGDENTWSEHSYGIYCDLEALKTELKRVFKNKPIPGQPTTKTGKPYKQLFYSAIIVNAETLDDVEELTNTINNMGYQAYSNGEWVKQEQQTLGYIQAVLGGIGAVSLLVAAIGITNTMMMSIYERTKEIGVMKVLGCDLGNIRSLFMLEAAYIGFIGGIVGLVLSYTLSFLINHVTGDMLANEMGLAEGAGISYIPFWLVLLAIVFSTMVGMVAGFFPARRAMRLSPLAAIRNE
ncbi:MAG: ABC transporter permease [Lachnospiraceae bacterium]|nr:ABC transporter permease [Lachnospiraceae bacterium]